MLHFSTQQLWGWRGLARWRSKLARSRSCSCCLKAPMLLAEDERTQFRVHPVVERLLMPHWWHSRPKDSSCSQGCPARTYLQSYGFILIHMVLPPWIQVQLQFQIDIYIYTYTHNHIYSYCMFIPTYGFFNQTCLDPFFWCLMYHLHFCFVHLRRRRPSCKTQLMPQWCHVLERMTKHHGDPSLVKRNLKRTEYVGTCW